MPCSDFIYFCKVAERVAAERAEACGNGKSTGYQIRLQRYEGLPGHCLCVRVKYLLLPGQENMKSSS